MYNPTETKTVINNKWPKLYGSNHLLHDILQHVEVDKVGVSMNVHISIIYKLICCEWIHGTGYWSIPISNLYRGDLKFGADDTVMSQWCTYWTYWDVQKPLIKVQNRKLTLLCGTNTKTTHFFGGNGRAYSDARWSNHWRFRAIDMFIDMKSCLYIKRKIMYLYRYIYIYT